MHPLLNIAIRAARSAGEIIVRSLNHFDASRITVKGQNEFVTEVDRLAEEEIIRTIRHHHPDHAFLAEESGAHEGNDHLWIIDPLDGTTNFIHGFPVFGVSIALQRRGKLEQAVVYDPLRQELFTATRGAGTQLDGRRIRASNHIGLSGALIGTGFPYRANLDSADAYMDMLKSIIAQTAGVRRAGAAALDLAYVAAGRLDGFWEIGLKPWDMAAGVLLIREAGGFVSGLSGGENYLETGNIAAAGPKVFKPLLQLLQPHVTAELK